MFLNVKQCQKGYFRASANQSRKDLDKGDLNSLETDEKIPKEFGADMWNVAYCIMICKRFQLIN